MRLTIKQLPLLSLLVLTLNSFVLSSCQKHSVHKQGHYTSFQLSSRSIASLAEQTNLPKTYQKQDMKQIYVFCAAISKDPKDCYSAKLNEFLAKTSNESPLSATQQEKLMNYYQFENIKQEINIITTSILEKNKFEFETIIKERSDLCNSLKNEEIEACLKLNIDQKSLAVLNKYYEKNNDINAHEYLYLTKRFENHLKYLIVKNN